jgi:cytochrome c oxidase subunit II
MKGRHFTFLLLWPGMHSQQAAASGAHSALQAYGAPAVQIEGLWWYMVAALSAGYLLTMIFLAVAIWRGRQAQYLKDRASKGFVIVFGAAVPLLVVISILGYSVAVGSSLSVSPYTRAMSIQVTGHRWWWDVKYMDGDRVVAVTANELYIPVGAPVKLQLRSTDVIHSFWVPNLSGKMDLIPGRKNEMWLRAERAGVWRGQCAEFCGAQHAHMSFEVVSIEQADFRRWLDWQSEPAVQPQSIEAKEGQQLFLSGPCALCHSVGGTSAHATVGPDLTHLAGRRMIGAGVLSNTRPHLEQWTANTQAFKPGNRMPRIMLAPEELKSIVSYLEGLR